MILAACAFFAASCADEVSQLRTPDNSGGELAGRLKRRWLRSTAVAVAARVCACPRDYHVVPQCNSSSNWVFRHGGETANVTQVTHLHRRKFAGASLRRARR